MSIFQFNKRRSCNTTCQSSRCTVVHISATFLGINERKVRDANDVRDDTNGVRVTRRALFYYNQLPDITIVHKQSQRATYAATYDVYWPSCNQTAPPVGTRTQQGCLTSYEPQTYRYGPDRIGPERNAPKTPENKKQSRKKPPDEPTPNAPHQNTFRSFFIFFFSLNLEKLHSAHA